MPIVKNMTLGISKFLRGKSHIVFFTCNTEKTITSKLQTKGYKELLDGIGYAYNLYCDAVKGVCDIFKLTNLADHQSHCCSVDSLQPNGLQHARLPCPSLSLRVCSNPGPLSQ